MGPANDGEFRRIKGAAREGTASLTRSLTRRPLAALIKVSSAQIGHPHQGRDQPHHHAPVCTLVAGAFHLQL